VGHGGPWWATVGPVGCSKSTAWILGNSKKVELSPAKRAKYGNSEENNKEKASQKYHSNHSIFLC